MTRLNRALTLLAFAGFLTGCGSDPLPTEPQSTNQSSAVLQTIPAGATIDSAWLQLYVNTPATRTLGLHQVTGAWDEGTVTWNSLGTAFDGGATATFAAADTGWVMVNITTAVAGWVNGSLPNHGLLINLPPDTGVAEACFASRESGALGPTVTVYFTTLDSMAGSETLMAGADATLEQGMPDDNFGSDATLCAGSGGAEGPFTRSLFRFEVQVEVDSNCTHGKGFWKNHAGLGPQEDLVSALLPQTLGSGGGKSLVVNTADTAFLVLQQHTFGEPSNGITKLYAHLLTAKLNIASGAASDDVDDVILAADAFLVDHDWKDWECLEKELRHDVQKWKGRLEAYNEGEIGPGSCDDEDDDCDDECDDECDGDHEGDGDHDDDDDGDDGD